MKQTHTHSIHRESHDRTCMHTHRRTHVRTQASTKACTHVHARTHTCTYTCTHTHIQCILNRKHAHTHTHTHTPNRVISLMMKLIKRSRKILYNKSHFNDSSKTADKILSIKCSKLTCIMYCIMYYKIFINLTSNMLHHIS